MIYDFIKLKITKYLQIFQYKSNQHSIFLRYHLIISRLHSLQYKQFPFAKGELCDNILVPFVMGTLNNEEIYGIQYNNVFRWHLHGMSRHFEGFIIECQHEDKLTILI